MLKLLQSCQPFRLVGAEKFGRCRGRRGALIGGKVTDDNIDFVSYSGYHRDPAGVYGAGHHFFIERPKVFQ